MVYFIVNMVEGKTQFVYRMIFLVHILPADDRNNKYLQMKTAAFFILKQLREKKRKQPTPSLYLNISKQKLPNKQEHYKLEEHWKGYYQRPVLPQLLHDYRTWQQYMTCFIASIRYLLHTPKQMRYRPAIAGWIKHICSTEVTKKLGKTKDSSRGKINIYLIKARSSWKTRHCTHWSDEWINESRSNAPPYISYWKDESWWGTFCWWNMWKWILCFGHADGQIRKSLVAVHFYLLLSLHLWKKWHQN